MLLEKDRARKREADRQQGSDTSEGTLGDQHPPMEQLPFPDTTSFSGRSTFAPSHRFDTQRAFDASTSRDKGSENRKVMVSKPDAIGMVPRRPSTVIRGTGKKSSGLIFAPKPLPRKRHAVRHAAMAFICLIVLITTLLAVIPVGDGHTSVLAKLFAPNMSMVNSKGNNTSLIASEQATATAVTQDGFDQGSATYPGVPAVAAPPAGIGPNASDYAHLNRFFYGQCTYWANMRYHQLTGNWVQWLGNAYQWSYQAQAYGWNTSTEPHIPSIVVLQPYVEGAGYFGHVAVAESLNANGSVLTSNWNIAGWAVYSEANVKPGPGVTFIWK